MLVFYCLFSFFFFFLLNYLFDCTKFQMSIIGDPRRGSQSAFNLYCPTDVLAQIFNLNFFFSLSRRDTLSRTEQDVVVVVVKINFFLLPLLGTSLSYTPTIFFFFFFSLLLFILRLLFSSFPLLRTCLSLGFLL